MVKSMMNKRKGLINMIFLVAVFALTMYYVFNGKDLGAVVEHIMNSNPIYWVTGIIFVVLFILGESVIIYYMLRCVGETAKITHCFLYSFVGFFFSCITPSATGGQPAQIYFMKKDKISIPVATVILMIVTITYKMVLVLTGIAVLVIQPPEIMQYLNPVWFWCVLGIALNVFCVVFMLILVFHPTLATDLLVKGVRIWEKIFKIKKADQIVEKLTFSMKKYQDVAAFLSAHKIVIVNVMIITIVQRYILFFVTYLTYLSFGLHEVGGATITVLQGMISVSVDMLPLPGGMGISESLFLDIFKDIFGEKLLLSAMVVSRGLSYYTQLLLSALMTVVAYLTIGQQKTDKRRG